MIKHLSLFKKRKSVDVVGLYLKPDGIAFAQLSLKKKQPEVIFCKFIESDQFGEQQQALQTIVNARGIQGADTRATLASEYVNIVHMESPKVEASELPNAIRWQLQEKIDFDPETAVVDYFNLPGQQVDISESIYAIAVKQSIMKEKFALIKPSGLSLQQIDITELAMKNIALCLEEEHTGLAMLHLFRDQGLLQVICDQTLYLTRRFSIGIDSFQSNGVDELDPEKQKQRVLDRLVLEIQRSLDFFESHFKKAPIQSVVLPHLDEQLPMLSSYVSTQLALHAWSLDINDCFKSETPLSQSLQNECMPAIGTALNCLKDTT